MSQQHSLTMTAPGVDIYEDTGPLYDKKALIYDVTQKFISLMSSDEKQALRARMVANDGNSLRLSSCCSGSNVLTVAVKERPGIVEHSGFAINYKQSKP